MKNLIEGEDYYMNEAGYVVFTAKFHLKKGFCCGNGCIHCPFDHVNVPRAHTNQTSIFTNEKDKSQ